MPPDNEDAIKVDTPLGKFTATGLTAAILLALCALFWQNDKVIKKVEEVKCSTNLSTWVYSQPRGQLSGDVPPEVWSCLPEWMYARRK